MGMSQAGIDALFAQGSSADPGGASARSGPTPGGDKPRSPDINRILGLSVPVTVTLAEREMSIEAILKITIGTIIEFEVPADSELILEVGGCPIGSGQAVKVGENFGLRISRIGSVGDRIRAMGGK
ncbi:MAG: FliM/FliN family flagellar motor switch protein [Planctomycetota bacterium]|nr:MAG: FliM/FliN family flagellar motor switch protein [Planctomycetota bacterium]